MTSQARSAGSTREQIGFVAIDKPAGVSTAFVSRHIGRTLGVRRVGHAGTLDPFATGLVIVLVGQATRLMPWVVGHDKTYELCVQFGARSDTDDGTGALHPDSRTPDYAALADALVQLQTSTEQIPPAVSAIHIDGERAYRRVRRGETVVVAPRAVRFDAIELLHLDKRAATATLRVDCSAGTYMRALARDLGELLGSAAYASVLRRTRVGRLRVEDALPFDENMVPAINKPERLVEDMPSMLVSSEDARRLRMGQRIAVGHTWRAKIVRKFEQPCRSDGDPETVAIVDGSSQQLVGMCAVDVEVDGAVLRPRMILAGRG